MAAYYTIFGLKDSAYPGYEPDVSELAVYAAAQPVLWSLALGWLILVCHIGYGGKYQIFFRYIESQK